MSDKKYTISMSENQYVAVFLGLKHSLTRAIGEFDFFSLDLKGIGEVVRLADEMQPVASKIVDDALKDDLAKQQLAYMPMPQAGKKERAN